jgi:hypothetical protein
MAIISIGLLKDVVSILESVMGMSQSLQTVLADGKKFAQDFKAGNVKQAQADADAFLDTLDQMEKKFDDESMDAIMDIYQNLKHKGA